MTPLGTLFKEMVIAPVLDALDAAAGGCNTLNTEAAIRLLLMIAAHESGLFKYARQLRGPALGFFQMEPATFDHLVSWLEQTRPHLLDAMQLFGPVLNQSGRVFGGHDPAFMVASPLYAAAAARLNLLRFAEPLPQADDLDALADYAKRYWNTAAGKAKPEDYKHAYLQLMGN